MDAAKKAAKQCGSDLRRDCLVGSGDDSGEPWLLTGLDVEEVDSLMDSVSQEECRRSSLRKALTSVVVVVVLVFLGVVESPVAECLLDLRTILVVVSGFLGGLVLVCASMGTSLGMSFLLDLLVSRLEEEDLVA